MSYQFPNIRVIRLFNQIGFLKHSLVTILAVLKYVGKVERGKYETLSKDELTRKTSCYVKKLPFKATVGWKIHQNFKILPKTLGYSLDY